MRLIGGSLASIYYGASTSFYLWLLPGHYPGHCRLACPHPGLCSLIWEGPYSYSGHYEGPAPHTQLRGPVAGPLATGRPLFRGDRWQSPGDWQAATPGQKHVLVPKQEWHFARNHLLRHLGQGQQPKQRSCYYLPCLYLQKKTDEFVINYSSLSVSPDKNG